MKNFKVCILAAGQGSRSFSPEINKALLPLDGKAIISQIIDKFKQRSEVGIKKYGTTLYENNTDDFLNHLQEELMDAILYIQKLRHDKTKK